MHPIIHATSEGVAEIRLNRPRRLNAVVEALDDARPAAPGEAGGTGRRIP